MPTSSVFRIRRERPGSSGRRRDLSRKGGEWRIRQWLDSKCSSRQPWYRPSRQHLQVREDRRDIWRSIRIGMRILASSRLQAGLAWNCRMALRQTATSSVPMGRWATPIPHCRPSPLTPDDIAANTFPGADLSLPTSSGPRQAHCSGSSERRGRTWFRDRRGLYSRSHDPARSHRPTAPRCTPPGGHRPRARECRDPCSSCRQRARDRGAPERPSDRRQLFHRKRRNSGHPDIDAMGQERSILAIPITRAEWYLSEDQAKRASCLSRRIAAAGGRRGRRMHRQRRRSGAASAPAPKKSLTRTLGRNGRLRASLRPNPECRFSMHPGRHSPLHGQKRQQCRTRSPSDAGSQRNGT